MRLTKREKEICNEYGAGHRDKTGYVNCPECPLSLPLLGMRLGQDVLCYATIDEDTAKEYNLERFK